MKKTGNEVKKMIREKVTELGHRDLSVRLEHYSSYEIALKKIVPISKVEEVVSHLKSVRRCQASGEILSGGNTFVFVSYMTWNLAKDESYQVEVPNNMIEAFLERIRSFGQSFHCSDVNKFYHVSNGLKDHKAFEGYTESDISAVLSQALSVNEEIKEFMYPSNK
jgi:hypothetical protein